MLLGPSARNLENEFVAQWTRKGNTRFSGERMRVFRCHATARTQHLPRRLKLHDQSEGQVKGCALSGQPKTIGRHYEAKRRDVERR